MKKIVLILTLVTCFGSLFAQQDDTTKYVKYPGIYGLQYPRLWANKVLRTPLDTIFSKSGIAILNHKLYFGDSVMWRESGSTYTANLPIRITGTIASADTSRGLAPSLATNAIVKKQIDSLAALIPSQTGAAYSVLGRNANSSGTRADISAATNEDVLFRNGDVLSFGKPNVMTRQGNAIGDILYKTSLADTTGLRCGEIGAGTYTISGSKLNVVVSSDYSWVKYDSLTSLDVVQLDAIVSFNTLNGVTYVAQFGVHSNGFPTGLRYSIYGSLSTRTDNGTLGRMYITSLDAGGTPTTLATSTSDLSFAVTDSIQVRFEKFENTVTFSSRNLTTNSAWVTVTYTLTSTQTSHSVGYLGIVTATEDYYIHQFKVSSKQLKNPDVYLFGDSKFTKSTYQNESLAALLKNNYGSVYANCAVGSTSADLMLNRSEIINVIKPKKIVIESSNDIRFGISSGTWQANLTQLYNIFTAAGIDVYFACFYETSASQAAMDTWLVANYPTKYIRRAYTDLATNSGVLLGDGIHLSAFGNQVAYNAIVLDGKLTTYITDQFTSTTAPLIPYNSGAGIVALGIDTVASSPTFGKLVRKTAGGGNLQAVTDLGSTTTNTITASTFIGPITNSNTDYLLSASGGVGSLTLANAGAFNDVIKPQAASTGNNFRLPNTGAGNDTLATLRDIRLRVKSKGLTIESPTSAENFGLWRTNVAITIDSISAVVIGSSPSVTINISFGSNITSLTNVFSSGTAITNTTTGQNISSGFNDATIPAGSWIRLTSTAQSGTVTQIEVTIYYKED